MYLMKNVFLQLVLCFTIKICQPATIKPLAYQETKTINYQQNEAYTRYDKNKKLPLVDETLDNNNGLANLVYLFQDIYTQNITKYSPKTVTQDLRRNLLVVLNDSLVYPSPNETVQNVVNKITEKLAINTVEDSEPISTNIDTKLSINKETVGNITKEYYEIDVETNNNLLDVRYRHNASNVTKTPSEREESSNEMVNNLSDIKSVENTPELENSDTQKIKDEKTINKWIEDQMLQTAKSSIKNVVDTLSPFILEILLENQITVTENRLLVDYASELMLFLKDLKLRPLLLDVSISHDRLLRDFLENYIVSLKSPPRKLSIIPVKETHLPYPIKYSNQQNGFLPSSSSSNSMSNSPLTLPEIEFRIVPCIVKTDSKISRPKRRIGTSLIDYPKEEKKFAVDADKLLQYINHITNIWRYDDMGVEKKESRYDFEKGGPRNIIIDANINAATASGTPLNIKGRSGKVFKEGVRENSKSNIEEEGPGIRIIGGSAATGSGTPLSVKGRSGQVFNEAGENMSGYKEKGPGIRIIGGSAATRSGTPVSVKEISTKVANEIEERVLKSTSKEEEEEGPGIRIIGGSAAVGSGTPVSVKGRSGNV